MDEAFAHTIIDEAAYGVLSLAKDGEPYGLPLSFARDGDRLVFHAAMDGDKYRFMEEGLLVHVVFVSRVKVPELYSEEQLKELADSKEGIASLVSKVFTTEFSSAMVRGRIFELTDQGEKRQVLRLICQKYTPDKLSFFEAAASSGGPLTRTFEIRMDEVTGKRKALGKDQRELKVRKD